MHKLVGHNKDKVIDLLTARLVFERTGVKLYDSIMGKIRSSGEQSFQRMLDQLQEHRDQEKEHEEWLEEQIRALGADAHAMTDLADLEARESRGIEDIILDGDNDVVHLLHALLTAELADNCGWELLVAIAEEADDRDAERAFKKRLHEEEEHLIFLRKAVGRLARKAVLGEAVTMPTGP